MRSFKIASKFTDTKSTISVYGCVKIENNSIKCFNGIVGFCGPVDFSVPKGIVLPKQFLDYVNECNNPSFEIDDDKITVLSDNSKAVFYAATSVEDFPDLNFESGDNSVVVSGEYLRSAVKQVSYITSDSHALMYPRTVKISVDNDLTVYAFDSVRASKYRIPCKGKVNGSWVFNAKMLLSIVSFLEDKDVKITFNKNSALIEQGDLKFSILYFSETYPNIDKIFIYDQIPFVPLRDSVVNALGRAISLGFKSVSVDKSGLNGFETGKSLSVDEDLSGMLNGIGFKMNPEAFIGGIKGAEGLQWGFDGKAIRAKTMTFEFVIAAMRE